MQVKMSLETPAGFQWDAVLNTEDSIIFCAKIDEDQVMIEHKDGKLDDPDTLGLVWALVAEIIQVSELDVVKVSVDDIDMSDEWIETVYRTVRPELYEEED